MGKPLSVDLRSRPVAAAAGGLSRRAAAERFGVSAAGAVRRVHASNTTGTPEASFQGGDMRPHRIEAFGPVILAAIEAQKGISLVELAQLLRSRHGASFAASTVWRFLDRHAMTFKKGARSRAGAARHRSPALFWLFCHRLVWLRTAFSFKRRSRGGSPLAGLGGGAQRFRWPAWAIGMGTGGRARPCFLT